MAVDTFEGYLGLGIRRLRKSPFVRLFSAARFESASRLSAADLALLAERANQLVAFGKRVADMNETELRAVIGGCHASNLVLHDILTASRQLADPERLRPIAPIRWRDSLARFVTKKMPKSLMGRGMMIATILGLGWIFRELIAEFFR